MICSYCRSRTTRTASPLGVVEDAPQQIGFDPLSNLRLSAHKTARASMPSTQSGLEFELMQSHPYSYSAETSDFAAMASLRIDKATSCLVQGS